MKVRNENYTNLNLEEILFKIKVVVLINKVNTLMASIFVTCNFFLFCYIFILLDFYFCYTIAQSKFRCYNRAYLSY